jgi:hypothetical protein
MTYLLSLANQYALQIDDETLSAIVQQSRTY